MGKGILMGSGSGVDLDFITAGADQILNPYVGADVEGEQVVGNIFEISFPTSLETSATGAKIADLTPTTAEKFINIPKGYNAAAKYYRLLAIQTQTRTVNPTTSQQTVSPDAGKFLSSVTVGAIPNQQSASGNTTLNTSTTSKSYPAGYYGNAHGAQVVLEEKSETPGASAKIVTPTSGKLLSKVTVNGDADLLAGNIKKGVNIFGVTGNWYGNKKTIGASWGGDDSAHYGTESDSFTMPANGMVYYGGVAIGYYYQARGICRIYKNGTIVGSRDLDGSTPFRLEMINKSFSANAGDVIKVECGISAGYGGCGIQAVIVY